MEQTSSFSTLIFWTLAILPGLLHPLLLFIYFVRFGRRRKMIESLLRRSAESSSRQTRGRQAQEGVGSTTKWEGNLDLDLPSYVLPTGIASLLSIAAAVVMLVINLKTNQLRLPTSVLEYSRLATPSAIAGFAGAYIWGLYDFVDRFRTLSLPSSAIHMIWFRLLLGCVMGGYVEQLLAREFAPVLVFALSSLPVPSLLKWMQSIAAQRFAFASQDSGVAPRWELVQGLTQDVIARLLEAGVTSVAHLGNQDPVNLLRRTNIELRNILDMMDQAYLATYVDGAIEKLRTMGIRGSIEFAVLWSRFKSHDGATNSDAVAVIRSLAQVLEMDEAGVRNLARNLSEDPQVTLLWNFWFSFNDEARKSDRSDDVMLVAMKLDAAAGPTFEARATSGSSRFGKSSESSDST